MSGHKASHIYCSSQWLPSVEWAEDKASTLRTKQVPLSIAYYHLLLLLFLIHLRLSLTSSYVYWCWSCFVYSGLTYEIYSGASPSTYIYSVVCYCVIYKKCWLYLVHLYTLVDDTEHPWPELSLVLSVFLIGFEWDSRQPLEFFLYLKRILHNNLISQYYELLIVFVWLSNVCRRGTIHDVLLWETDPLSSHWW